MDPDELFGEVHDTEYEVESTHGIFTDISEAKIVEPAWLIKDLLPVGLVFIGAPPKAGKSTLTMAMAALVGGLKCKALPDSLSQVVRDGSVLAFSYEANAGELRYMLETSLGVKLSPGAMLVCDDPWEFRLDDPDGEKRMFFWLKERNPRLVILDPLRDFHSLEEKDSGSMNRLLRPLRQWAVKNDACVMIVHHAKKREDGGAAGFTNDDLRGSGALFGIADGILMLTGRGDDTEIRATFKKGKGWTRTITIASYDRVGTPAEEKLGQRHASVMRALHAGAPSVESISSQLKIPKRDVQQCLEDLVRNGLARYENKTFIPIEKRGAADD